MNAFRLTILAGWLSFTASAQPVDVSPDAVLYHEGVQRWEAVKAAQSPVCDPQLDAYEVLQGKQTDYAVLVLHGFTLAPRSMDHYVQLFAGLGANVIAPRLARHFTLNNERDLDNASADQWLKQVEAAYLAAKRLGRKVVVVGFSLGGLLAGNLGLKHPEIDSLYLFSPAWRMTPEAARGATAGWMSGWARRNPISLNEVRGLPIGCGNSYYSSNAGLRILNLMANTETLARPIRGSYPDTGESIYRHLKMPTFMGLVRHDEVIDTEMVYDIFRHSGPRLAGYVYLGEGEHGTWATAGTMDIVPKTSYEGHDGQKLREQILSFWKDSHTPEF